MRASTLAAPLAPDGAAPVGSPRALGNARPARVAALAVVVGVLGVLSVGLGAREVAIGDVLDALAGSSDSVASAAVTARLPRTVLAVVVGGALAVSGATMQAVTRNPLAEPGILGVSGGAALAVVLVITTVGADGPYASMAAAVVGSALAATFVYLVGSAGAGGTTPAKLALAGAATTAATTSLTSAVLLPRVDVLTTFRFWQIGGVGGATWDRIAVVAPVLAAGVAVCVLTARSLDAMALGDDVAVALGTRVGRARLVAAAGAVVLCGVATSVAGPIAFVGLVVPHLCRRVVGTDHRWLLPCSALGGAALLLAADVVGRVVARPEEIQVGIVTAVIGAPVLIHVVRSTRVATS